MLSLFNKEPEFERMTDKKLRLLERHTILRLKVLLIRWYLRLLGVNLFFTFSAIALHGVGLIVLLELILGALIANTIAHVGGTLYLMVKAVFSESSQ
jgi:hypothetical protein